MNLYHIYNLLLVNDLVRCQCLIEMISRQQVLQQLLCTKTGMNMLAISLLRFHLLPISNAWWVNKTLGIHVCLVHLSVCGDWAQWESQCFTWMSTATAKPAFASSLLKSSAVAFFVKHCDSDCAQSTQIDRWTKITWIPRVQFPLQAFEMHTRWILNNEITNKFIPVFVQSSCCKHNS